MLCCRWRARLLKHKDESQQSKFYRVSENIFKATIDFYGRTLGWVLERQNLILLVAVATLVITIALFAIVPKGFFFQSRTLAKSRGVSEASQSVSFARMAQLQQNLAAEILKNPAVESLSSFIGVDGTNTTMNSGRIQINLKPLKQRKGAMDVIRDLQKLDQVNRWHPTLGACSRCRTFP